MESIKLNLIPSGVNPTCHCSQYDEGRIIRIDLFDGLTPYALQSGDAVTLNVRKPDNTIITTSVTVTAGNNYVEISTTEQMCAVVGFNLCDLTITNGAKVIGTLNFIMAIERDVLADGIPSQSVIEDLDELVQEAVGDNYYTKSEVDSALDGKADKSTTYTKTEVDSALALKANSADVYTKAQTYNKTEVDSALALKANKTETYEKYKVDTITGLSLDMFEICPTQYSIVQYNNSDALQHSTLAGSGISNLRSKLKNQFTDFKVKLHYGFFTTGAPSACIAIAVNSSFSIQLYLNATSNNVKQVTDTTITRLSGIYRNTNCRSLVIDDEIRVVKNGTKIAIYLIDNGIEIPIFANEWEDILSLYSSTGISESDIGFGLVTNNSARNEPLIYDFTYQTDSGDHFMSYDETNARLTTLEDIVGINPKELDLFMFMGQSNMAGRGTASQAPSVVDGAGFEFRAISDPTKLYPIIEPFGIDENVSGAIYDYLGGYKAKTGDMVASFVNAYYKYTNRSIVGVSASEGGTRISYWQPDTARYNDAVSRFNTALSWLATNGYIIKNKYILWCQGESDGDDGMSTSDYKTAFMTMANSWFNLGIDKIFIVKIGNYNGTGSQDYNDIMTAQNELCQNENNIIMVSTDFASMKSRDLMKDDFHYKQAAYNEVGTYAGINTALFVKTGKEPTMYDTQNNNLYFSHKN